MPFTMNFTDGHGFTEPFYVLDETAPLQVDVDWAGGDVFLEAVHGESVALSMDAEPDRAPEVAFENGVLSVRTGGRETKQWKWGPFSINAGRVPDLRVVVPAGSSLRVKAAGGDVAVQGEWAAQVIESSGGDISVGHVAAGEIKTSGGDVSAESLADGVVVASAGGDIAIDAVGEGVRLVSSGGDITVGRVGVRGEIKSSGGDLELGRVQAPVEIKTSGGDIEIAALGGTGTARIVTTGGDIKVGVAAEIKVWSDVKAGGGGELNNALSPRGEAEPGEPYLTLEARTVGGRIDLHDA